MNRPKSRWAAWTLAGVVGLAGCQHCQRRCPPPPPPMFGYPSGPIGTPVPGARPVMTPPPGAFVVPPPPQPIPVTPPVGLTAPAELRSYGPVTDSGWRPSSGTVRLAPPETIDATVELQPPASARLSPPEAGEPRLTPTPTNESPAPSTPATEPAAANSSPTPSASNEPPLAATEPNAPTPAQPPTVSLLPVGIPHFIVVKEGVAAGLRPLLEDGLDWLQAKNYRTVLHVKRPGEDDSADRKQVEKRGIRYRALDVSPTTFGRAQVEEFNRIVNDRSGGPLFVYDRDGTLAGGLWYLFFRTAEGDNDQTARSKAARFGLRSENAQDNREVWLGVQKYLSEPR